MKINIIYLAAGNSRRFQGNKLLYEMDGKPMYQHLLLRLSNICRRHEDWSITVVTQYEALAGQLQALWKEETCSHLVVLDKTCAAGASHTVKAGVMSCADAEGYSFFVADQPYLTEQTAEAFLCFCEQKQTLATVGCDHVPGNPIFFPADYREELLKLTGDAGGRKIWKNHAKDSAWFEVEQKELRDIDFPSCISKGM